MTGARVAPAAPVVHVGITTGARSGATSPACLSNCSDSDVALPAASLFLRKARHKKRLVPNGASLSNRFLFHKKTKLIAWASPARYW